MFWDDPDKARAYLSKLEAVAEAASDEDMFYAMDTVLGLALVGIEKLPDETPQMEGDEADAHLQAVREGWLALMRALHALRGDK